MKNKNGRHSIPNRVTHDHAEKYVAILRELPDIVYKIDPKGYFTFINKSVSVLGYNPDEIIGKHFSKIIHPEDVKLFSRNYVLPKYKGKSTGAANAPKLFDERRTGERRTKNLEIRLIPKDWRKAKDSKAIIGMVIAFGDVSAGGYYGLDTGDGKRKFQGTLGIIRDITDRKRLEDALKKSREYFLTLTENSSDIIIILDRKGTMTYASPSIERFSGYKKEELIGKSGFGFIVAGDLPRAIYDFGKAILTKDVIIPNVFRIRHKDGSERIFEGLGKNLLDNPVIAGFVMNVRDITDRKKAEEALKESREKYRCLVDGMHDGLMQVDNDDRILFVNEQICKILGYTMKELLGQIGYKIFFSESDQKLIRKYNERRLKQLSDKYEIRMKKRSGEFIWVQIRGSPVIGPNGTVLGSIGAIADIDQRKHAEEALRKSEEKYRDLVENINDIVFATDLNGIVTYISPVIESLGGYKPAEVIGKPFTDFIYPEHLLSVKRRFQDLIDGKQEPAEYKILTKSGDARWVRSFSKPVYKEHRFMGIQGVITDIDQRKQMDEKLQYQADMLANVSDAIISTDLDFKIRTWNKAAERIYGWQAWEVIGKPVGRITRLVYPNDQQNKVVAKFFRQGYWQGEVIQTRKDGTKLNVLTAVALMRDSSGNPVAAIAVNRNVTERKKTENELVNALNELSKQRTELNILTKKIINAQEEERRYLTSVIHDEFLQGIVSILYFLQTFDVSSLGKEVGDQKEGLMKAVKDSIEKGRALITETEPIRELSSGLIEAVKKTIALRFSNTAVRVRFIHPKKMPRLERDIATSVFRIVQEALFNIQRHAKATSVLVRISVNNRNFDVEVRDNGVGFIPELVAGKKTGHYGLLSMQERTHLLGGDLVIISKPGKGTMVKFKFSSS
ncbi:MAG TPA: PAS domain S-box protein [bacterium]